VNVTERTYFSFFESFSGEGKAGEALINANAKRVNWIGAMGFVVIILSIPALEGLSRTESGVKPAN
jgi:hypothetical protein